MFGFSLSLNENQMLVGDEVYDQYSAKEVDSLDKYSRHKINGPVNFQDESYD